MEIQTIQIDSIYRIDPYSSSAHIDDPLTESDVHILTKLLYGSTRNSFGLTIDPINGDVWDTENSPFFSDEINLV